MYPKNSPEDVFAENLLCHLENLGMLPPAHEDNIPNTIFKGELSYLYQWESEDE